MMRQEVTQQDVTIGDAFNYKISDVMSDRTFCRFSSFVHSELGIKMPPAKKTMLQSRLLKRLRALGIRNFDEYYDYVFSPDGRKKELSTMVDLVTTNKTDFFRESRHFEYLTKTALPELINNDRHGVRRCYNFWSSACSSGEEAYTTAMVLSEFAAGRPGFRFSIMGTDISTRVLKQAALAIYDEERVAPVPLAMRKKYLLRGRDKNKGVVRIVPELRAVVRFQWINFLNNDYHVNVTMDVIFCRNVIIYFDRPTQEIVLNRLCRHLIPGGYMFIGHSETLNGLNVPLVQASPTVYRKPL